MMHMNLLLRMKRLADHPPSMARVKFFAAVVLVVCVLAGIEHFIGWPEALSANTNARGKMMRP